MLRYGLILFLLVVCVVPSIWFTTSLLDNNVPLGEFLDEQLARVRENQITETDDINESDDEDSPPRYELPIVPEGYVMDEETTRDFLACNDKYDLKK